LKKIGLGMVVLLIVGCGGDEPPSTVHFVSMQLTPDTLIVAAGKNRRIISELLDDQGHRFDVSASAAWSSSDPAIATAGSGGLVVGVGEGMTTISAAREGESGSAVVTVVAHDIASIDVQPAVLTLQPGATSQLTATATLSDSSTRDVTQGASWTSNNLAAVTVSGGLVTAVTFGQATINAGSEAITSNGVRVTVGSQ